MRTLPLAAAVAALAGWLMAMPRPIAQSATAEDHKAWMADAADAQDELRELLAGGSAAKITPVATRLQRLLTQTRTYWTAKKMDDVVQIARDAEARASEVVTAARARNLAQARTAFDAMGTRCNACHDLHPEKR